MNIDAYIGLVVVVELDTGAKHEGVLLESNIFGYVKIINSSEVFQLPSKEIVGIWKIDEMKFTLPSL